MVKIAEEKPKEKYVVVEVPTQTELAIQKGEKVHSVVESMTIILNKLDDIDEKIKKLL